MLNSLRWKLVIVYFVSALSVVLLLMAGTYYLLSHYFMVQTDLALQYKMAGEFNRLGLALPVELEQAERSWREQNEGSLLQVGGNTPPSSTSTNTSTVTIPPTQTVTSRAIIAYGGSDDDERDEGEDESNEEILVPQSMIRVNRTMIPTSMEESEKETEEERFDNRLSSIFVVPDQQAVLNLSGSVVDAPIAMDREATERALTVGHDLRTLQLDDGARVRLLTYRIGDSESTSVIQLGVLLENQDHVLSQYLIGLALLGFGTSLLVAMISWLLAGRAIRPAQNAWDQQQVFIANASHELRTPLAIIRANTEMGIRSKSSSDKVNALHGILNEVDNMGLLVEDMLVLSRLDAHQLRFNIEPIELQGVIKELQEQMKGMLTSHEAALEVTSTNVIVLADRLRLRQVLLILLDNALRHNAPGNRITVSAIPEGKMIRIQVVDQGGGIGPKHLAHVFDRFYQAPNAENAAYGFGLGLSIAKGIVEAQGGHMEATSEVGKGTAFSVILPAA